MSFWPVRTESGIADMDAYAKWCVTFLVSFEKHTLGFWLKHCIRDKEFNQRLVNAYVTPRDFEKYYRQHIAPWTQ